MHDNHRTVTQITRFGDARPKGLVEGDLPAHLLFRTAPVTDANHKRLPARPSLSSVDSRESLAASTTLSAPHFAEQGSNPGTGGCPISRVHYEKWGQPDDSAKAFVLTYG